MEYIIVNVNVNAFLLPIEKRCSNNKIFILKKFLLNIVVNNLLLFTIIFIKDLLLLNETSKVFTDN